MHDCCVCVFYTCMSVTVSVCVRLSMSMFVCLTFSDFICWRYEHTAQSAIDPLPLQSKRGNDPTPEGRVTSPHSATSCHFVCTTTTHIISHERKRRRTTVRSDWVTRLYTLQPIRAIYRRSQPPFVYHRKWWKKKSRTLFASWPIYRQRITHCTDVSVYLPLEMSAYARNNRFSLAQPASKPI